MNSREYLRMMQTMQSQQKQLDHIEQQGGFWRDFASNVAGNAVWDAAIWIASRLLKKL